jgi:hypothetical protein
VTLARTETPDPANKLRQGAAWGRLDNQTQYYGNKSAFNKRWYISLKIVQLMAAAGVPVMASVHAAVWVTGGLGAVVVVFEGIQQLCQFEANWINYRSTGEALESEKALYLAQAGPYADAPQPSRLLAERVETLLSQEHTKWTSGRQEALQAEQGETGLGGKQ